jgi:hypothetical protein
MINIIVLSLIISGAALLIAASYIAAGTALALSVSGAICVAAAYFIDVRF